MANSRRPRRAHVCPISKSASITIYYLGNAPDTLSRSLSRPRFQLSPLPPSSFPSIFPTNQFLRHHHHPPPPFDIRVHHQSSTHKWGDRSSSVLVKACSCLPLPASWSILCWQKWHKSEDFQPDALNLCSSCCSRPVNVFAVVFKLELLANFQCINIAGWITWQFVVKMTRWLSSSAKTHAKVSSSGFILQVKKVIWYFLIKQSQELCN